MKLSSKKHGKINAFYYKNPTVFHTYALNGHTIGDRLNWMYKHIKDRTDLNKGDLKLVTDGDGVWMVNLKTGGRMYFQKSGGSYVWFEEAVLNMETMHEDYEYNQ